MSQTSCVFPEDPNHTKISLVTSKLVFLKVYRPISNTPFIAKLIDKTVLLQLNDNLQSKNLCTITQSAYMEGLSYETVILDLVNNVQSCIYDDEILEIFILVLSPSFDIIDHFILPDRWKRRFQV